MASALLGPAGGGEDDLEGCMGPHRKKSHLMNDKAPSGMWTGQLTLLHASLSDSTQILH